MSVHLQKLTVEYEYPVYFTTDVFAARNLDFAEAVARKEPERRHRILPVVERAVADAWPRLIGDIRRYAGCHRDRLELVADPLVTEGGEAAKNDASALARLHGHFQAARMDRQSFVVIVGGGALLDMAGYAAATAHRGLRVVRRHETRRVSVGQHFFDVRQPRRQDRPAGRQVHEDFHRQHRTAESSQWLVGRRHDQTVGGVKVRRHFRERYARPQNQISGTEAARHRAYPSRLR